MLTAVAFVPQAPALHPELGRGLDAELGPVRDACRDVIRRAASGGGPVLVVGERDGLTGLGTDLGPTTVGEWLVRDALGDGTTTRHLTPDELDAVALEDAGTLVVVGDGSACRSEKAPGHLHPLAAEHDAKIARALRDGDAALLHPGSFEDEPLLVAGLRTWDAVAWELEGGSWDAELLYDDAPFGVGYFVALWTRA